MARSWPVVDLATVRLDEGSDGRHRSWIMLFPEGKFEHPAYGTLDFSTKTLSEIQRNFEAGAREIEIALDRDHDQGQATGWLERLEQRPALGEGQPAGLWGLVRWTPLGLSDIQNQIYRYFSPEFKPTYTNQRTGKRYRNVLVGGALTNRPFLKVMPAVQLAEVSTRPWGEVDKTCLPDSAFLDPQHRRLPVYEGAGPKDADGRYTRRGKLNINGVRAALAAVHGAHTGKAMTGLPGGVAAKLERWLERYGSGDGGDGGDESMSKKAAEYDPNADDEMLDEADGDGDEGFDAESDTHGAMTTDGHSHGQYGEHSHEDDADHSEAPMARGKSKKMSERGSRAGREQDSRTLAEMEAELVSLREMVEERDRKLDEAEVGQMFAEIEGRFEELDAELSKSFREGYHKVMLSEELRSNKGLRKQVQALLLAKAAVDTQALGASYDMEERTTVRRGQPDDGEALLKQAEKIALSEHKVGLAKLLRTDEESYNAVMLRAARETGYKGAEIH